MSTPQLKELLAPLSEGEDDLAWRRVHVDRAQVVDRMLAATLAANDRPRLRWRAFAALALAASVALAAWGALRLSQTERAEASIHVAALRGNVTYPSPDSVETAAGAEARIDVGAGFEIALLENTKVSWRELRARGASGLQLERGRVRCVVPHDPSRKFTVVTAAARVIDVGTTFSVSVEPASATHAAKTRVHVEEGEVLVEHAGGSSHLKAAQTWSSPSEAPKPLAVVAPAQAEPTPSVVSAGSRREPSKRRPETLVEETRLLRSGLAAEQKGELSSAARAFETLLVRYPDSQLLPDAKAGLSRVRGRLENAP